MEKKGSIAEERGSLVSEDFTMWGPSPPTRNLAYVTLYRCHHILPN